MNGVNKKFEQYEILLKAIDFFTQRVHIKQIMEYGFEFLNKLLPLKSSALFIRSGNEFTMVGQKRYPIHKYQISSTRKLDELPLFHGRIVTNNFQSYFKSQDIELFQMKLIVPLIIDTYLAGFIISSGKVEADLESEELNMVDYLMKLINHSLENNQRLLDFQAMNANLDQKIFNLFVVNQSTKALLSELKLEKLYSIATDVFSEITGSIITSFGIYDPLTNKIKILGYRNVHSYSNFYTEFELKTVKYSSTQVLHTTRDIEIIKSLFVNWQEFNRLEAEYIVLIVKDEVLGIVTISKSVNDEPYGRSDFELIESLASTTYIAIVNARLFKEINQQKEQIEKKYRALTTLNKLVKTINSAQTSEELITLTLQTLQLGYGVKKAFYAEKTQTGDYCIVQSIGLASVEGCSYQIPDAKLIKLTDDTYYDFTSEAVGNYFTNEALVRSFGDVNGIVLAPICFEPFLQGINNHMDGYIVVVETRENLKEEEILVIDTITKNITPILNHMKKYEAIIANMS